MNNKLIKILSILFIGFIIIVFIYKFDSVNQLKQRMIDTTKELMDCISNEDYDGIRGYVKKIDGNELSDEEISNFLLNTNLHRAMLIGEKEPIFTYKTNVSFFNTHEGTILFSYKALDGDEITNQLKYVYLDDREYFIVDKIQESKIKKKKYPIAVDLADGKNININESKENISKKIIFLSYVADENQNVYVEVIENTEEDIKIKFLNKIMDINEKLKENYEGSYIEWNQDKSIISIYYNESVESNLFTNVMHLEILSFSYINQVLSGNKDWHLTIKYYDYQTKELLKTTIIR